MNNLQIELQQIGKRFGREWLFQNVSVLLEVHKCYALTGNNGSGKSTLLQIIYGYQTPSKGKILIHADTQSQISTSDLYKQSAFVAPYIDLPDELTVEEQLRFHFSFKKMIPGYNIQNILSEIRLADHAQKRIKNLSSGMRQRLKLAQAFFADVPVIFLDEPCTNLDAKGTEWYRTTMQHLLGKRLVIIASNQSFEYDFAHEVINIDAG